MDTFVVRSKRKKDEEESPNCETRTVTDDSGESSKTEASPTSNTSSCTQHHPPYPDIGSLQHHGTMGDERLSNLSLLHIHPHLNVDVDASITDFIGRKKRRLDFEMLQRTRILTWSVLHRMRLTMKMTQHSCISSTSKLITEMYGGHIPVMVDTVVDVLDPKDSNIYVDMTFGAGGHSKAILQRAPEARIVCLDQDPKAHESALALSKIYNPGQVMPCMGKFSSLPKIMADLNIEAESVDGFLFDVGASSMQFDTPERGFSLSKDGILDMRMDQGRENTVSAMDVVNNLEERDLTDILRKYGDEKKAKQIARALVEWRYMFGKIRKTKQLVDIIESVFGEQYHNDKLNRRASVATRSFQALRIFVNNELNELHNGLVAAHHFLKPEGKCLALTFHSLEDRIVKRHFHGIDIDEKLNMSLRDKSRLSDKFRKFNDAYDVDSLNIMLNDKKWSPISKKIMHPNEEECKENPRARSAKLRAARKL